VMPDRAFEQLESRRLVLRRFADSDTEPFLAYRLDPETRRYQGWGEYTFDDAVRFVAGLRALHPDTPGRGFQFATELKATHEMIGDVYLLTLREKPDQAEIGFTLATGHRGRGYATEAVLRVLEYAFETLGKHRVMASALCDNTRSIALLERIGMKREGRLRQSARFEGGWADECRYAMLRREWDIAGPSIP